MIVKSKKSQGKTDARPRLRVYFQHHVVRVVLCISCLESRVSRVFNHDVFYDKKWQNKKIRKVARQKENRLVHVCADI